MSLHGRMTRGVLKNARDRSPAANQLPVLAYIPSLEACQSRHFGRPLASGLCCTTWPVSIAGLFISSSPPVARPFVSAAVARSADSLRVGRHVSRSQNQTFDGYAFSLAIGCSAKSESHRAPLPAL